MKNYFSTSVFFVASGHFLLFADLLLCTVILFVLFVFVSVCMRACVWLGAAFRVFGSSLGSITLDNMN